MSYIDKQKETIEKLESNGYIVYDDYEYEDSWEPGDARALDIYKDQVYSSPIQVILHENGTLTKDGFEIRFIKFKPKNPKLTIKKIENLILDYIDTHKSGKVSLFSTREIYQSIFKFYSESGTKKRISLFNESINKLVDNGIIYDNHCNNRSDPWEVMYYDN